MLQDFWLFEGAERAELSPSIHLDILPIHLRNRRRNILIEKIIR